MNLFSALFFKVSPMFLYLGMGFIAGRWGGVKREPIGRLLIYFLSPGLIFTQLLLTQLGFAELVLPVIILSLAILISFLFYQVGHKIWPEGTRKNLLGFSAGNANSGYFGIPVADALFGTSAVSRVILCSLGYIFYENSVGFYWSARGHSSVRGAVKKVLKLPGFYATLLGITLTLSLGATQSDWIRAINQSLRGAYSILGMSMIGLALSELGHFKVDFKLTAVAFSARYIVWSALLYAIVAWDQTAFQIFDISSRQVLHLMAWVPLAANTVAIASELKTEPEQAAIAVFLSAVFSLFWIPFVMAF